MLSRSLNLKLPSPRQVTYFEELRWFVTSFISRDTLVYETWSKCNLFHQRSIRLVTKWKFLSAFFFNVFYRFSVNWDILFHRINLQDHFYDIFFNCESFLYKIVSLWQPRLDICPTDSCDKWSGQGHAAARSVLFTS